MRFRRDGSPLNVKKTTKWATETPEGRRCTTCLERKPLDQFHKGKVRCKRCLQQVPEAARQTLIWRADG